MPLHRFAGTSRRNKHRDDRAHGRLQNPLAQNDVRAGEPSRRWEARWNKWKGQAFNEAIGRSRGGRTTKIHALTDDQGRPRVLALTPGNTGDVTVAPALIKAAGPFSRLLADKAYDANWLRELIVEHDAEAVIPCNPTRKKLIPYDAVAYRQRNLIERMFGRLKDFRRIATRYDKLARNFFSAALIAAIVIWCIN